ncbi:Modification methylase DpnIIB [Symmachiella dynata]|uniref:site-specific DNA-methyltransferase n=1 Tax=Symmachiella dynata TaxID=2527995 RepID=UPI00118C240E|nr:site-specific DNA-methyltransferase [Symmachiella dynata]QDT49474.1 Modification methylase DpnIIB [Symmachiella dynata]
MAKKKATKKKTTKKTVETLTHDEAKRSNIPTAELQSVMGADEQNPIRVAYERRNRDLDPQLVWKGKDEQDWSDLVVHAPPLYIQEKVHPKVLVEDLLRESEARAGAGQEQQLDLFADFNGLPEAGKSAEFYQHEGNWTNRMILGDSLQVMASLAEREGLRGKVQCIYIDPPYGIKFNSNFQWSTTSRDVKDGKADHITREPEQVKAFRDTWRDGIHSYLTYLRDRLTVARDLLSDQGSIFVQIGDENLHRARGLLDEVFGDTNFCSLITIVKTSGASSPTASTKVLASVVDYVLWYAKSKEAVKYRQPFRAKEIDDDVVKRYRFVEDESCRRALKPNEKRDPALLSKTRIYRRSGTSSQTRGSQTESFPFRGGVFDPEKNRGWSTTIPGLSMLEKADRLEVEGKSLCYVRFLQDFPVAPVANVWEDVGGGVQSRSDPKVYVVQTGTGVVQRCVLMATDPGDLVLDPTCGSGTTAYVAEQWGRRWITIDTSRVALALARARIMGARYPYYLLGDSPEGKQKEAEVTRTEPSTAPTYGNIRQGFVYERVPHITLKSIANNAEIDVIWEKFQETLEPLREKLNKALKQKWEEWEIPREAADDWSTAAKKLHADWWQARIARQQEIDASIAAKADHEYLYDKPYEDKKKVRVAGPFTVESISPHRVLGVDEDDELIDDRRPKADSGDGQADFVQMVLDNLQTSGVQQSAKADRITFTSISGWPGQYIAAEARYVEGESEDAPEKRAGIFIGPEFGTVARQDLVRAAREAGDAGFDVVIACAFNFDAHSAEFNKLGAIPVLKARMNADLHMADDLKNTGKGNLFVIFGEPDIDILDADGGQIQVKINGVDVFHPQTGEVHSDDADGIACWFVDTDYNEESFFVRHAYFLGANDPYKSLKTTLKAEIDREAWESLNSDTSRPFEKPKSGRIAVKVINHLGDEVMKVFRVEGKQ